MDVLLCASHSPLCLLTFARLDRAQICPEVSLSWRCPAKSGAGADRTAASRDVEPSLGNDRVASRVRGEILSIRYIRQHEFKTEWILGQLSNRDLGLRRTASPSLYLWKLFCTNSQAFRGKLAATQGMASIVVPAGWRRRLVADLADDLFLSIFRRGVSSHLSDLVENIQTQIELSGHQSPFRPIASHILLGRFGSWRVQHIRAATAFLVGAIYCCASHALFGRFIGMQLAGVRMVGARSGQTLRWFRILCRYTVQELTHAASNRWRWWPAVDILFLMVFRGGQYLHDVVTFTEIVQ
eukprot:SAG31_NODE_340_length_17466_cov_5.689987_3_plen_297_part_00